MTPLSRWCLRRVRWNCVPFRVTSARSYPMPGGRSPGPGRRSPDRRVATPRQRTPRGPASRPLPGSRASPSVPRSDGASRRRSSTGLPATGQRAVPSAAPLRASASALAASSVDPPQPPSPPAPPPPPPLPTPAAPAPADAAACGSQAEHASHAELVAQQEQELQELRRALHEQEIAHQADRAQVRASYARQLELVSR